MYNCNENLIMCYRLFPREIHMIYNFDSWDHITYRIKKAKFWITENLRRYFV